MIFFVLFFLLLPIFWVNIFRPDLGLKEKYIIGSSFYWIFITPVVWFLNKYFNVLTTPTSFWLVMIMFTLVVFIVRVFFYKKVHVSKLNNKIDYSLLLVLFIYIAFHSLFYYFYETMPESDGYGNILAINEMMKTGIINTHYRPLFFTAMTSLGLTTNIDMYQIHVFWSILLTSTYLITLSVILDIVKIKNFWNRFLFLSLGLSIPVLNMEIDFFRPQNIYIILFPLIFYSEQKNWNYFSLFISAIGLGYHQFFIFPLLVLLFKIFFSLNFKNKARLSVFLFIVTLFFVKNILSYLPVMRIVNEIWRISNWRIWFLNSYQTFPDNVEMGWPGVGGAIKYYAYYFGPSVLFLLGLLIVNIKKLYKLNIWFLLIFIYFLMCEIFPRLGVVYLPERFPVLIGLTTLLLSPYLSKQIIKYKTIFILLIIMGVFGSVYVSWLKGSLTTREEVAVSNWIKKNTDKDSIILTQRANKPMVVFFSERKYVDPGKIFFEGDTFSGLYVDSTETQQPVKSIANCDNCYLLYSTKKNEKLHKERIYWKDYTYLDINLKKFDDVFKKIYDWEGIYIWKI